MWVCVRDLFFLSSLSSRGGVVSGVDVRRCGRVGWCVLVVSVAGVVGAFSSMEPVEEGSMSWGGSVG